MKERRDHIQFFQEDVKFEVRPKNKRYLLSREGDRRKIF